MEMEEVVKDTATPPLAIPEDFESREEMVRVGPCLLAFCACLSAWKGKWGRGLGGDLHGSSGVEQSWNYLRGLAVGC